MACEHASVEYLKKRQTKYPHIKDLKECIFSDSIRNCEVCLISKLNRLSFRTARVRANETLQIVHSDVMGKTNPPSHPKGYKFISVFIDDFSRLAMAFPMKTKVESGSLFESFVVSARNLLSRNVKTCYFRTDQGTEYTGGYTVKVLKKLGAEHQLACSETPQHNGTHDLS